MAPSTARNKWLQAWVPALQSTMYTGWMCHIFLLQGLTCASGRTSWSRRTSLIICSMRFRSVSITGLAPIM
ncbi:hypothetical protein DUNSADRAFT_5028 [Dunaliella salina]|uniref:Uncharacterized protein n=1 Tax=Dunaliella salina TaxID=3046 RepID=A0ABQ7HAB6_DUNSA|nr:hypothetical protein DUNSADRAFT_5028 [Dunaliella salina]|eukprot:KAF5843791.1 hypothetical protein DUNSADRAFT_5028 [Dunaliella salina]